MPGLFYFMIWVPIQGYEGLYELSLSGFVKSLARTIEYVHPIIGKTKYFKPECIMEPFKTAGYWSVGLRKEGKSRTTLIHILIGQHFIPNPENKREINHKDGNKLNCWINNLEWNTSSENKHHAYDTGLRKKPVMKRGRDAPNAKTIINTTTGRQFVTVREAANFYGYSEDYLQQCLCGVKKNCTTLKYLI